MKSSAGVPDGNAITSGLLDTASPDPQDEGKFTLAGEVARVVHPRDGWYVHINLGWFQGTLDRPRVHDTRFHWYAFAIPSGKLHGHDHYLICDYFTMRDWVLEFSAPLGRTYRDQVRWRADMRPHPSIAGESQAYFRWGDEPLGVWSPSRVVRLDNADTLLTYKLWPQGQSLFVGTHGGADGESEAHRRLKLYVSKQPGMLDLHSSAVSELEHEFCTGDRVDLLFENHRPVRTVVEVELAGEQNLIVGVHQAIKYRSLAAAERTCPLDTPKVRAFVVAYEEATQKVADLARGYAVKLLAVDRAKVLAPAV